ncbi:hypothetical protein H6P81_013092 [Aristolochia fimbriata]|uniref:Uncharacterized protein n=1 Tax=Aristolochia fimbriata TaxID=158543 RepID=A0AAV7EFA3_ARIFI|nr:hypothetical protein H6P81_013092 [Aristolochia fimbriata]
MMAHPLSTSPAVTANPNPLCRDWKKSFSLPCPLSARDFTGQKGSDRGDTVQLFNRRVLVGGLTAAAIGLSVGNQNANAAARRPPPPPPTEKKDPSVSGVQAKVLASIKRKEAMKESMAKLREKGKPVTP